LNSIRARNFGVPNPAFVSHQQNIPKSTRWKFSNRQTDWRF